MFLRIFYILLLILVLSTPSSGQINFTLNKEFKQILMPANINKEERLLLFDNASQVSILFISKDELRNYKVIGKTFIIDSDGKKDTAYIVNGRIKIQKLKIKEKTKFLAIVGSPPEILSERGVNGILGNDLISKFNWIIDLRNQYINTSYSNSLSTSESSFWKISDFKDGNGIFAAILCSKTFKDTFSIDFGYNQIITTKDSAFFHDILYRKLSFSETVHGLRKDTSIIYLSDKLGFINSACLHNIPIAWDNINKSNLIGMGLLTKFNRIYIDNKNTEIWVQGKDSIDFLLPFMQTFNQKLMSIIFAPLNNYPDNLKLGMTITEEEKQIFNSKFSIKLPPVTVDLNGCPCN